MKGILIEPGKGPVVTTLPDTLQGIEAWLGGHADQKYFSRTPAILMHSAAGWKGNNIQPMSKDVQAEMLDRLKDTEVRV